MEDKKEVKRLPLHYTAQAIKELEDHFGRVSFARVLDTGTIEAFTWFVKVGMHLNTEEEAMVELNKFLAENDIKELTIQISEGLQESGFLPRSLNVREMLNNETLPLPNNGKRQKA